jgi:hypothetical protein
MKVLFQECFGHSQLRGTEIIRMYDEILRITLAWEKEGNIKSNKALFLPEEEALHAITQYCAWKSLQDRVRNIERYVSDPVINRDRRIIPMSNNLSRDAQIQKALHDVIQKWIDIIKA